MVFYVPVDIKDILEDLKLENDRSVALVGAALVEHALQEAIRSVLRGFDDRNDSNLLDRLFGVNGSFAGLSAKILGAFALKVIGRGCQRDLELINKIRNDFAHDMNRIGFETDRIRVRCHELALPNGTLAEDDARERYLVTVQFYAAVLNLWAIRELLPEADRLEIFDWLAA
jgi:mannitol operon repressor